MSPPEDPLPRLLYHYTDESGLTGIVESRSLWATNHRYLNDETEGSYARGLLAQVADRLRPEFAGDWAGTVLCTAARELATSGVVPDTFVCSFCSDGDNLSQWRGYGGQGRGFAIGFDREALWQVGLSHDYQLASISYDVAEQEAELEKAVRDGIPILAGWAADPANAPSAANRLVLLGLGLSFAMLRAKHPYFKDEREWRLVRLVFPGIFEDRSQSRLVRGVETPYEVVELVDGRAGDMPITEIVLGPMARSDADASDVRGLLDRNGMERVSIRGSAGPLRGEPRSP